MTIITKEILEAAKSQLGGYSAAQLKLIGMAYPLPKGWRKQVAGKEFPDVDVATFIALKDAHLTPAKIEAKKRWRERSLKKRQERQALIDRGLALGDKV